MNLFMQVVKCMYEKRMFIKGAVLPSCQKIMMPQNCL